MNSITRLTANIFFAIIISLVFADCAYFGHGFIKASPLNAALVVFATCFVSSLLICELFSVSKESNKIKNKVRKTHLSKIAKRIAIENARNNRRQRKNIQTPAATMPQSTEALGTAKKADQLSALSAGKTFETQETAQTPDETGCSAGETQTEVRPGIIRLADGKWPAQDPESPIQCSTADSEQMPKSARKPAPEIQEVRAGKKQESKAEEMITGSVVECAASDVSGAETGKAVASGKKIGSDPTATTQTQEQSQTAPAQSTVPSSAAIGKTQQSQSSDKDSVQGTPVQMVSLYVGNLSNDIQASDLENLLKPYGQPTKIKIFRDNKGRRRKAYAYVGMAREPAQKAAKSLNNTPYQNRTLNVKVSYSS